MTHKNTAKTTMRTIVFLFLLCILPLSAFAQFEGVMNLQGKAGIADFVKSGDDTLYLYVNASYNGAFLPNTYYINVTRGQAGAQDVTSNFPMTSCTNIAGATNYTYCKKIVLAEVQRKSLLYTIELFDNSDVLLQNYQSTLDFDSKAPVIAIANVEPSASFVRFTLNYDDYEEDVDCSKLKTLDFYNEKNSKIDTKDVSSEISDCTGTIAVSVQSSKIGKGSHNITIKAKDAVGNEYAAAPYGVEIPSVVTATTSEFNIINSDGNAVEYCFGSQDAVSVVFGIALSSNISSISLDMSALGGGTEMFYVVDKCTLLSSSATQSSYFCEVPNVYFSCSYESGQTSVQKQIPVTLIDYDGEDHTAAALKKTFKIDSAQPKYVKASQVLSMFNDEVDTTTLYLGSKSVVKFYATEESGISTAKSYLDVSGTKLYFSKCVANGTSYGCVINNANVGSDNGTATLHLEDVAGNIQDISIAYQKDDTAPVLKNFALKSASGKDFTLYSQRYLINASSFKLVSDIDALPGKVYLLQSSSSSANVLDKNYSANCKKDDKLGNICDIDSVRVISQQVLSGQMRFVMTDLANNYIEQTINVSVLEHDSTESNILTVSQKAILMQKTVSRDSAIIPQNLLFYLDYSSINSEVTADLADVVIDANSCKGDTILGNPVFDYVSSKKLYFSVYMNQGSPNSLDNINSLNKTCNMTIFAIKDGKRLAKEIETVTFYVPLSDDPQSTLGNALQAKIDAAMNDGKFKLANKLKTVTNIMKKAKQLCNIIRQLGNIGTVMDTKLTAMDMRCKSRQAAGDPSCIPEVQNQNQQNQQKKTGVEAAVNDFTQFCQYFNCQPDAQGRVKGALKDDLVVKLTQGSEITIPGVGRGSAYANVESSLLTSAITLCLPGILSNLEQYRQIQCAYIDCLKNQVPRGVPIAVCEQQYKYQNCMYVSGQLFASIPYVHILQTLGQQIKAIVENPMSVVFGEIWKDQCTYGDASKSAFCRIMTYLNTGNQIKDMLKNFKSGFDKQSDYCARAGVG